jgi:hypothetical protein
VAREAAVRQTWQAGQWKVAQVCASNRQDDADTSEGLRRLQKPREPVAPQSKTMTLVERVDSNDCLAALCLGGGIEGAEKFVGRPSRQIQLLSNLLPRIRLVQGLREHEDKWLSALDLLRAEVTEQMGLAGARLSGYHKRVLVQEGPLWVLERLLQLVQVTIESVERT